MSSWDDDSGDYIKNLIPEKTVTDGAAVTFDENGYSEPKSVRNCITGLKNYVEDKVSDGYTATKNAFNYMAECYQEGEENREKTEEAIQEADIKMLSDVWNNFVNANEENKKKQEQLNEEEYNKVNEYDNEVENLKNNQMK